jgi:pyruvate ferredoxin oxidoreductase alpha subunit
MKQRLLTGNGAAAWGVRLARADYVPAFPITPQTEIIETLAAWMDQGEMPGKLTVLESEHSMVTAAGAAAATGVRVFTATSSQGLLYAAEMLYTVSGWRVPFVLANVSRGLAAPITLEADHNDILALRDCGCLQIHCATAQEVLDSLLLAYRLAEHSQVRLPVIVNQDGFTLSFTREPVDIPDAADAAEFVGDFVPQGETLRAGTPQSQAVAVLGGSPYSYFRYQAHLAAQQALAVYDELADEFAARFGRHHPAVECLHMQDADYALVLLGCYATKARDAVERLRAAGWRIGLVRPRLLRPFPLEALRRALAGVQAAAVIDQNLSPGKGGILHGELCSALYGTAKAPLLASFVGGLGGRDISAEEFFAMAEALREAAASGATPPPRLLYTAGELREVRKWQAIAHAGAPTQPPLKGTTP